MQLRVVIRPDENPYCAFVDTGNGPQHLGEFCQDFSPEVVSVAAKLIRAREMMGTVQPHGLGWGIRTSRTQLRILSKNAPVVNKQRGLKIS